MSGHQPGWEERSHPSGLILPALALLLVLLLSAALAHSLPRLLQTHPGTQGWLSSTSTGSDTEALLARAEVPALDPYERSPQFSDTSGICVLPAGPSLSPDDPACDEAVSPSAPQHALGDRESFWILDLDAATSFPISATLQHVGSHLYMWAQDGIHLHREALQRSAAVFAETLYPTLHRCFGSEWRPGIDQDERLHILHAHVSGAAGYFLSDDEYPRTLVPTSNQREMFYINPQHEQPGTDSYDATLAHEFQHMVHWFADPNEDAWLNEGASELAMHVCGYARDARIHAFARHPDIALTHWESENVSEHYAASFLFLAYFTERYGTGAMRELVASPLNGVAGVESVLRAQKADTSFEQLFSDWVIANYLDSRCGQTKSSPYAYRQLDIDIEPRGVVSSYPAQEQGEVQQYGADYFRLLPADHDLQLAFSGTTTTTLVPNQPHSGRSQWWSNRGDSSNMTLTRQFDLSDLTEATLQFWLWYDIEDGWDHAFVELSTDGGTTWHMLSDLHNRPGYTGVSGAKGSSPTGARWVEECFDLSHYAGQPVWIRFDYVTDEAVNRPGLCVDDISIPELGYWHDAESGDDGWMAQGFVRCDNIVPQRYILQLIRIPEHPTGAPVRCPMLGNLEADTDCAAASRDRITIQQMKLGENGSGAWRLSEGSDDSELVLVVSATSVARGVMAPYEWGIRATK